jgi:thioesterase domain-containing protein/acyl carrier protein
VPRPENLAADLDEFQKFVRTAEITVLDLSTAHWAAWCAWMASGEETIPMNVRTTIIGGERASAAALKDWFAAGGRSHLLINTYGPTEASVVGTAELIRGDWNETGDPAIGRPLPGVFARVGDSSGRRVPPGAAGELWLGGICVGPGYWQRPDLTAAAFHFIEDRWWYRTGDRACWDSNGKLRFLGRQDDQLKIRGNRVEPNEVIRVLESFPGVSAAHAGPVPGHGGGSQLAAWVRWNEAPEDGWPGKLAAFAAVHLPAAAVPTRWAAVAEFKLTERGKLDRRQLPEPLLTGSSHVFSEPPATPAEKWLADTWSELLGVRTIGRDESFFELGGHSLAALKLFAQIAKEWNIRIPMAVLIQAPTPRMLGAVIDRERASHGGSRPSRSIIVPVRPDGHLPPLFCIHGGDGGVFFYHDLAKKLPPGRPLLAIESPALSAEDETSPVPVEETAAAYVAALREQQPNGPYHLAGYSYGGLLVFEIARRLLAEGESIAFAGLFDTINPAFPVRQYTLLERAEVFWDAQEHLGLLARIGRILARTREGIATHFRVRREILTARATETSEPHSQLRMIKVRETHWESMKAYQPGPLDCHITLFKSCATEDKFEMPDDYGWRSLVNSMEIVSVDGTHLTMFAPQHIDRLAIEINKRLPAG